ncbi:ATP-binding protein [Paracidovorax cattleyae]|uniref:PRTase-CE domain-containing protein n=1 Tax=Paracidovorax cattleyae TaxID=80868 RepID=A0A1H0N7C8_9BURK|nr:ATP-binding protein [Paracidovorax cattleyae]SDO88594.1 hypothetical protein SAMN04489708_104242 [Paracidovorax cattleyae]
MKTRQEALELVVAAFLLAQRKLGPEATTMTIGVLKNRLLQITDRRFDPKDFGVADMRGFLAMLAPQVLITKRTTHGEATLTVAPESVHIARATPAKRRANDVSPMPVAHAEVPQDLLTPAGRNRPDLWTAVMDYASGVAYVWDERLGEARPRRGMEVLPVIPTVTSVELGEWRRTFVNEHKVGLEGADLASALRWQEQGLATIYLPAKLRQPWNRELGLRVRQRLQGFFAQLNPKASSAAGAPVAVSEPEQAADVLGELLVAAKDRGDGFTVGELLAQQLQAASEDQSEQLIARIVNAWASPRAVPTEPTSLSDLSERLDSYSRKNLATAFINAIHRVDAVDPELSGAERDFAFKLKDDIAAAYGIDSRSPVEVCRASLAKLEELLAKGASIVTRFLRATPATARIASSDLLPVAHRLQPLLVAAEQEFLGDLDVLVGPAFRKLFEAYEKNEDAEVIRRAPEYLDNIAGHKPTAPDPRLHSQVWLSLVQPVLDHLATLVEDATSRGEIALAPSLVLRNPRTKGDLRAAGTDVFLSFSLVNQGKGYARDVSLLRSGAEGQDAAHALVVYEPTGPFAVSPGGEQLVRLRLQLAEPSAELRIPVQWGCVTGSGRQVVAEDELEITQQVTEPDWDALLSDPPYTLNPIKRADRLYGRGSILQNLLLNAMAGTSTFVWGQKRIGKTSLLQVFAAKLSTRSDTICILLRMGELTSLHEGQLAHRIARRLADKVNIKIEVPQETDFGAGISLLVPFVERLSEELEQHKFVVIIDEFDDLDPAFYTGERGRQFMKGLRSASEAGLTFFFVGSERMDAIFERHQADLNKWTNVRLDRIENRADCQALIRKPVDGALEFDTTAVDFIVDYTAGNPFYIHNFCYQLFQRCLQEHRTFIDANDTSAVRHQLFRSLGATNFSHLWEDNPVLDIQDKRREAAENCIALACISALGGRFEDFEELLESQEGLPIAAEDRASVAELRRACARLHKRGVLSKRNGDDDQVISLQIFREWLGENARSKLIPIWMSHRELERTALVDNTTPIALLEVADAAFPVSEDDLLAVAQKLTYCGKQKDVAEIKQWLRQFDDDTRIETAYLLLRRISEQGFITEGMRANMLAKVDEMIVARRVATGSGTWTIVKNRRTNLAIGYLDVEHKSGATMARDMKTRMQAGKCASASDLDTWMRANADKEGFVAIVDDFAGTGQTLVGGLKKARSRVSVEHWERYVSEGRLCLFLMYAFPDAIEAVKAEFPGIPVLAAHVFGDELRACNDEAGIFETPGERAFDLPPSAVPMLS